MVTDSMCSMDSLSLTTLTVIVLSLLVTLGVGVGLGLVIGTARGRWQAHESRHGGAEVEQRAADHAIVREGLERLHDQMRDLEHTRISWQSQLHEQVEQMRHSTESLRRETSSLSSALRKPAVRGRWGELHLRRAVEVAGLVDRCDFVEQTRLEDGAQRPDLVVHLAGGRQIVIDAKVALDAYLDATAVESSDRSAEDFEAAVQAHLRRHARQLRTHIDHLGAKAYWRALPETPEFVVLFVPAESFLSAALEVDASLIEYAAERQIVLASPTTLIALLRTVAHGWSHLALSEQAHEIQRLGRDLHRRLGTLTAHFDKAGRSLNQAVEHYNRAMGSLESRVLVSARRFDDLGLEEGELPTPRTVELRAVDRRGSPDSPPEDLTVPM